MSKITAIQMTSGSNVSANLHEAGRLIAQAASEGAELCVLPENFALMGHSDNDLLTIREQQGQGEIQDFLMQAASRHKIWIVGGTVPLQANNADKMRSACLVYNDDGECIARYDKMHLFDVHLPDRDETYTESATTESGDELVIVDTPVGKMGLAICYDLRFPELFRGLSQAGAEIIALPAAFTATTGKAHWEVLLRARAIENLSYVIAANQGGYHVNGRETHGHSMVVDPWGSILAQHDSAAGLSFAQIDTQRLAQLRQQFPSLQHRRL
jgi:nitrilase